MAMDGQLRYAVWDLDDNERTILAANVDSMTFNHDILDDLFPEVLPPEGAPFASDDFWPRETVLQTPFFPGADLPANLVTEDSAMGFALNEGLFTEDCTALDLGTGLQYIPWQDSGLVDVDWDAYAPELNQPWLDASYDTMDLVPSIVRSNSSEEPIPDLDGCSTLPSPRSQTPATASAAASVRRFETDNKRWHATQARLREADASFLYGVLTTKIFCKPSCPSRRASRRHVRYFPFPGAIEAAAKANFRPCKRCIPHTLGAKSSGVLAICEVLRLIIADTFDDPGAGHRKADLKLEALARFAGLSAFHFHRLFKATTQLTPGDFIYACRALALQDSLRAGSDQGFDVAVNVPAVLERVSWTPRAARKALGDILPLHYARGVPSKKLQYCIQNTPCGPLCIVFSFDEDRVNCNAHAVSFEGAEGWACQCFSATRASGEYQDRLTEWLGALKEASRDRDIELTSDVLPSLWRARVLLKITQH